MEQSIKDKYKLSEEEHMWYLRGEIMNDYASLDTAIEIMAYKITDCFLLFDLLLILLVCQISYV